MPKQQNEHPHSMLNQTFGVAKKLSGAGQKFLKQLNASQTRPNLNPQVIEGFAQTPDANAMFRQADIQQILGLYLPQLSQRMLGRNYGRVSLLTAKFSPISISDITDYLSQRLSHCAEQLSTVDQVLAQAGAKNLDELRQDFARSGRLSQALLEQNKWFAATQGAFAAVTGVVGVAIDVPSVLLLALRVIYQTGRAYGFELNQQERDVVDAIFKQVRFDLLAEKQTLLLGMSTFDKMLQHNDIVELQRLAGSSANSEWLKNLFINEDGQAKWSWLNQLPRVSVLSRLTPLIAAGIGGGYNGRFIQDVGQKSQHIFSVARDYLTQHPEQNLSILAAYQQAVHAVEVQTPLIAVQTLVPEHDVAHINKDVPQPNSVDDAEGVTTTSLRQLTAEDETLPMSLDAANINVEKDIVTPTQKVKSNKPRTRRVAAKTTLSKSSFTKNKGQTES
ncbi:EcsC family protein [Acinetobacter sp. MD2]|uniref:EcsC family protein n=1 Tax=Acinetobacter sp. MD2 TaxID=2600066 RepID=UPI002D1EADF4|nr:EcsC family protein [Acinetobacter sp. MD2]MEB3768070.1 EcsC family protein [Acinetobacter sp. MD2]